MEWGLKNNEEGIRIVPRGNPDQIVKVLDEDSQRGGCVCVQARGRGKGNLR